MDSSSCFKRNVFSSLLTHIYHAGYCPIKTPDHCKTSPKVPPRQAWLRFYWLVQPLVVSLRNLRKLAKIVSSPLLSGPWLLAPNLDTSSSPCPPLTNSSRYMNVVSSDPLPFLECTIWWFIMNAEDVFLSVVENAAQFLLRTGHSLPGILNVRR